MTHPDLLVGACQRTGDALGKSAIKGTGGKQLYFFLNSAATHHFSRRSAPRGAADVIKTEDANELDNSLLEGGKKFPKFSIPTILVLCKSLPRVVGKILASPYLLNSPV